MIVQIIRTTSGLTFRHELSKNSIYGFLGKGSKEEFESKCQT